MNISKFYPNVRFTEKRLNVNDIAQMFAEEKYEPVSNSSDIKLAEKLLENINNRKKQKTNLYNSILAKCSKDIYEADIAGKNGIEFKLPEKLSDYPMYCCKECLNFVSNKLQEELLDVCEKDHNTIYITWQDLEQKVLESKKLS